MKIGFIGLGIMGSGMAGNLASHGFELVVFNRTAGKAQLLVEKGSRLAASPAELGEQVDVVFTMLPKPEAVEAVATGKDGFLIHLKPGSIWVDCSTVNPSFSRRMGAEAAKYNVRFLDAPVFGSKTPAAKGELNFFIGGRSEDLEACRPYFEAMGKKIVHAGGQGMGASMKMCINLMAGSAMLAFTEAAHLGESLGIPRQALFDTLIGSAVAAPLIGAKRGKFESGTFDPEFSLQWMRKDLQLITQTGYEQNVPLPVTNAAKEVFAQAEKAGLGEEDYSAVYKFL